MSILHETMTVGLDLHLNTWHKHQQLDVKVLLNNEEIFNQTCSGGDIEIRSDEIEILEDAKQYLKVVVTGMQPSFTKIDDFGEIVDDVILDINNVYLDEIPLDHLVYKMGVYKPDYPAGVQGEQFLEHVHHLGWNGEWNLEFTSPIY